MDGQVRLASFAFFDEHLVSADFLRSENSRAFANSIRIRAENVFLVDQLAKEKRVVETALTAAKQANRSKNQFLASASHDLRQPLHALSLFFGVLRSEEDESKRDRIITRIDKLIQILQAQFDNLLDLFRFDAGGIEVERTIFRLDEMLEREVDGLGLGAESKGLRIQLSAFQCSVFSDRLLVERVLSNLLTNAIRYTNEGSITVTAAAIFGTTIEVSIADTGIGIAPEDRKRVFDDYAQLNNPARSRDKGAGLGLAIIERIDKLLGLDLRMNSTLGFGSEFIFRLPISNQSVAGPAPNGILLTQNHQLFISL